MRRNNQTLSQLALSLKVGARGADEASRDDVQTEEEEGELARKEQGWWAIIGNEQAQGHG